MFEFLQRYTCNALIKSRFEYACAAWYSNLTKKLERRLKAIEFKRVRFCLRSKTKLVTNTVTVQWEYFQNKYLAHINKYLVKILEALFDITVTHDTIITNAKSRRLKLVHAICSINIHQNALFYTGPLRHTQK